jgi:riboflavin-specific deaminase-like protein
MSKSRKIPFVMVNGAVSADGKLALENRSVIQFSSPHDQRFVLQLRATADAVLCGADTVETFSIDLGADSEACRKKRLRHGLPEEPIRVLVTDDGEIDPKARIFQKSISPVIVLTTDRAFTRCSKRLLGVATVKPFGKSTVSFARAFRWLRQQHGIQRLLCEGGGETNAALIRAGVVDELHLTVCPILLRGGQAPTFCDGEGAKSIRGATRLKLKTVKVIQGELFLTYTVMTKAPR